MAKLLIVVAVVVLGAWLLFGRRRGGSDVRNDASTRRGGHAPAEPAQMVACAHCGVHLPRADAVSGGGGQPYCSEAHRDAGPR